MNENLVKNEGALRFGRLFEPTKIEVEHLENSRYGIGYIDGTWRINTLRVNSDDSDGVALFPTIETHTKSYPTKPDKYIRMREEYFDSLKED